MDYCCCCGKRHATVLCAQTGALPYCSAQCEAESNRANLHERAKQAIARAEQSYTVAGSAENKDSTVEFDEQSGRLKALVALSDFSAIVRRHAELMHADRATLQQIYASLNEQQQQLATNKELINAPHLITLRLLTEHTRTAHDDVRASRMHGGDGCGKPSLEQLFDERFLIVDTEDYRDVRALEHRLDARQSEAHAQRERRRYALHIRRPRYWWTPPPTPATGVRPSNIVAWQSYYAAYWPWLRYWNYDAQTNTFEKTERWFEAYYE